MRELAANWSFVAAAMDSSSRNRSYNPEEVADAANHGLLYSQQEAFHRLEPWWETEAVAEFEPFYGAVPPAAERLSELVRSVAAAGESVFVVDITPPWIKDLGLWQVKSLIPGAYPMNFDSRWPHLGGRRLRSAPITAGVLEKARDLSELNLFPHPFP